ncbi:hypothetical protein BDF21DRAFT_486033 [Thamnidium elegans]|nr:hypothetical protein BDF21DRAFT_486033 [Thamnidium elegans]
MVSLKTIITLSFSVASVIAANVNSISECPSLPARVAPAKDITDLRIDDIKIIGALGDSIMAGFAMMGLDYEAGTGALNLSLISEYRGNSYAIGGDTNAVTLANFMKKYNPDVQGASVLSHLASICHGPLCGFPITACMKSYIFSTSYKNDWKMITIQIGSNDQCASCDSALAKYVSPDAYGQYVEAAIERIKKEIPKVVVNLLGTFKVSGVFPLTDGDPYCVPNGILENEGECACADSPENLAKMDTISDAYNQKLEAIANKHKGVAGGTFAVMYSPAPIDISSFPVNALSNVDCFHPSLKGHQYIAKAFWNQLFMEKSLKPPVFTFEENLKVYCPTGDDRLPTA